MMLDFYALNSAETVSPPAFWQKADDYIAQNINGDIGIITRRRPAHLGSKSKSNDVLPAFDLNIGKTEISLDDGLKYHLLKRGNWDIGPILEYRQSYSDNLPRAAHKMPDAYELGLYSLYKTPIGEIDARLRKALNSYCGWSGDVSFDTEYPIMRNLKIVGEARVNWADSNFSDTFFGLKPKGAKYFRLPQVLKDNYYSGGVAITLLQSLSHKSNLFTQFSHDRIYGERWNNPIIQTRNSDAITIGVVYHIGK